MITQRYERGLVSVHMLRDTTPEKQAAVLDHGRFIDDLARCGLGVVLSNKNTFLRGDAVIPAAIGDDMVLRTEKVEPEAIDAMYARLLAPVTVEGSEDIPKLNENPLKRLAASKIDLYHQVLKDYQVPTYFVSMQREDFGEAADIISAMATDRVVLKRNSGAGGMSTRILEKADALAWVDEQIENGAKPHILQPEVMFGVLPASITAAHEDDRPLIDRARRERLLYELRAFVVKRGDEFDVVPILRVVPDKTKPMQGHNDDYIDIVLEDELMNVVRETSTVITENASRVAGNIPYVIGAVDYYFDEEGTIKVMEANYRSPQLPVTRENPIAGRATHIAVADALLGMVSDNRR